MLTELTKILYSALNAERGSTLILIRNAWLIWRAVLSNWRMVYVTSVMITSLVVLGAVLASRLLTFVQNSILMGYVKDAKMENCFIPKEGALFASIIYKIRSCQE